MESHRLRILLVDDNLPFLDSMERYFESLPKDNVDVVGRVTSGADAVAAATRMHPDLILMDLAMPGMSGLDAARLIKKEPDAPKILMLTAYGHEEYRKAATTAGADGFIAKSDILSSLMPTVRSMFETALHTSAKHG